MLRGFRTSNPRPHPFTLTPHPKVAAATVGAGLSDFLADSDRRAAFALTLTTAVLGVYTAMVCGGGDGLGH